VVVADKRRQVRVQDFPERCFLSFFRDGGINPGYGGCKPFFQDNLMPFFPLGSGFPGLDIRAKNRGVAEVTEPCEGVIFEMGFGKAGGGGQDSSSRD